MTEEHPKETTEENLPGEHHHDGEMIDVHHDPHLFTEHTSPKLTFFGGIVLGIIVMTMGGVAFFGYIMTGGDVGYYDVKPLQVSQDVLEEPIQEINVSGTQSISLADHSHVLGANDDFAVTLVQYVDYECLFCKKFFPEVRQFTEENADSVRFVVKHDPLVKQHPHAKAAAIAAECAGEQDKFFEYSDYIFANQSELSDDLLVTAATELELDEASFSQCLVNESMEKRVEMDAFEADNLGIASQPNLVVWYNDTRIELIDGYVAPSYLQDLLATVIADPAATVEDVE